METGRLDIGPQEVHPRHDWHHVPAEAHDSGTYAPLHKVHFSASGVPVLLTLFPLAVRRLNTRSCAIMWRCFLASSRLAALMSAVY